MPVKILASNNYVDEIEVGNNEVIYRLPKEELPIEYDDCAIINTKLYDDLFGKLRRESKKNDKLLSVIRIQYKKKVIYREYVGKNIKGSDDSMIAITTKSFSLLSDENQFPSNRCLKVSEGCKFLYYWNHPSNITRKSYRLSVWGIFFGLLGCILSICF